MNNNTRFKFRVWHNELKKFSTSDEWFISLNGKLCFWDFDNFHIVDKKLYYIQQYTGVTDKNKMEIYEGDIIKHLGMQGVVNFIAGMFVIDYDDQTDSGPIGFLKTMDMEVVGNIFDNPELLK